jgi:multiple sugar transport system permease protein
VKLFLLPWVVYLVFMLLLPLALTFCLSFYQWDFLGPPRFVGSLNWWVLSQDPRVWNCLSTTGVFAGLCALSETVGGLALGLLMHQRVGWIGAFRALCYLPTVLSGVASTLIGMWLFQPDFGLINGVLACFGVSGPRWLLTPGWALLALWLMTLWGLGRSALLILAARQSLPEDCYEAARLDGAGDWEQFRFITLPLLRPALAFVLLVSVATALQSFTGAYVATGGGPAESTTFFVLYLYQVAFQQLRMGYAAVLGLVLFALVYVLSLGIQAQEERG